MEKDKIKSFACPIHKDVIINKICTDLSCINPICCIDCVLSDNCLHLSHKQLLLSVEDYIDHIVNEYKSLVRLKLGKYGPPKEFTDYLLGEDESLQNLTRHIEEQKQLIERTLNKIQEKCIEICSITKTTAFNSLDEQFNILKTNHDLYKAKLQKFYGNNKKENPTKTEILNKINAVMDVNELIKIINEFQKDFLNRAPNDQNLLNLKIEEVRTKLNTLGESIKLQQKIRPKFKFSKEKNGDLIFLENIVKNFSQMLADEFKLECPINKLTDAIGIDTTILTSNDIHLLNYWINPKQKFKFKLLYRATRDGFSSDTFHKKVGSHKPTIVIIHSDNDKLFGGYTDVDWTITSYYKQSSNAFLFSLNEKAKYPIKSGHEPNAIYTDQCYGPVFGGGYDICICDQSNVINYSNSNFPHSYDSKGKNCAHLTGMKNFRTKEIEVFHLV